jgi:hypothetical protein
MDEPSQRVASRQPEQPENENDSGNGVQHNYFLFQFELLPAIAAHWQSPQHLSLSFRQEVIGDSKPYAKTGAVTMGCSPIK